jgi:serine/threonine protein kinase/Tol biopolymer transport system component
MGMAKGSRLGDYEIVTMLGEGGMGAVYLARDHRLKRDVAIKILTGAVLARSDAAEQVLQEARSAARLNHPNICTIHEVGETDGVSFIVMERVEGGRLSALIPSGGMPIDSITRYGAQIADALAHAHERGIIHRDLKSGNVMVTPDGRVKVLDFGIARSVHESADEETSPAPATEVGTPGTLEYMAPEVLNGDPASALSDIWSLGVLLYEMIAAQLPFAGRTPAATASAILQAPLPPLPPHVPASLRAIVQRCLARPPGERYQHAYEVRAAMEVLRDTYGHRAESSTIAKESRPGSRRRVWLSAAALALVAIAIWIVVRTRSKEPALLSSQRSIAAGGASYRQATLSPDGGFVAFAYAGKPVAQIWIKNLAQGDPVQITSGDVDVSHPAWSPKNDQIVFARRGQGLWSVPPLGGTARRLLEFGASPQFSTDGERLVFERNGREIWTARADGSEARRVEGVPTPWYPGRIDPAFSPDASSIVYFMPELGPNGDLWIVPASGGAPRQLTHDLTEAGGPIWIPDGRFIIFSSMRGGSRTLWRVRASGGAPEPLTVGAGEDLEPALSRDGRTLVYTNVHNQATLRARNPETGAERVIVERRRPVIFPRISPDGSKVAFFGFGDVGDVQIFVVPTEGGAVQQLTQGRGRINTMPRWSHDGSLIYYYEQRPGASLQSIPASGGVSREVRPWKWESHTHAEFNHDGSLMVYYRQAAPGEAPVTEQTVIEDVASGKQHALALPIRSPRWSPDGRTVVGYTTPAPTVVATCPVDGGACQRLTAGQAPVWSPDGSRIYFLRDTATPTVKELWSMRADGGDERKLFDRMGPYRAIDVAFDVARNREIVWSDYIEGRHELWQAILRP